MGTYSIETFDLTKKYKLKGQNLEINALNKANISIEEGEIFGLLGPNGAGKTTMIQILTTLLQPTSGYAVVDGLNILKNPRAIKDKIALMLGSEMLYYRVSGYDNLKFFCKIYKIPNYKEKIFNITEEFGLKNWLNQYVSNYSTGMKLKLALCRTFLLERKILFLDEPTLGLDLKSIAFIIDKLKSLKKTILMTSHDMNAVEKLCNRIAYINNGVILKIGTQNKLKELMQTELKIEVKVSKDKDQLKSDLNKKDFVINTTDVDEDLVISLKNRDFYNELLSVLNKYKVIKIKEQEISLEELFLKILV